jgi:hypothetical protein
MTLAEVSGVGKRVHMRDKFDHSHIYTGTIVDEVTVFEDGENKYFIQRIRLNDGISAYDDTTELFRLGYYTERTDGRLCLGSQFGPVVTRTELKALVRFASEKGWLA